MKAVIIMSGLAVGIIVGLIPRAGKPAPLYWKLLVLLFVTATIVLNLVPPLAGTLGEVKFMTGKVDYESIPVLAVLNVEDSSAHAQDSSGNCIIPVGNAGIWKIRFPERLVIPAAKLDKSFTSDDELLLNVRYNPDGHVFEYFSASAVNPIFTLPYVAGLGERIRIMNFHVPVAWITVLAYLVSMIYSILYLRRRNPDDDLKAVSAAVLGTLFCLLATVTGMIWAKFNWGTYWNWDPREVSIFILLLVYFAYFALRFAVDNEFARARLSAVYSILAFITVPFLVFILPRLQAGLHPGSGSEGNFGPVLSSGTEMLNPAMQVNFSISMAAFTMLFFWMMNLTYRYRKVNSLMSNLNNI